MDEKIKHIYLGLPNRFKDVVLWVAKKFRTNLLSHQPGGSDIVVEYHSGKIFGYNRIKYPSRYIHRIFRYQFFHKNTTFDQYKEFEQINIIKKEINRLFTRIYEEDNFDTVHFEEIWNSKKDKVLPWIKIEEFEKKKQFEKDCKSNFAPIHLIPKYEIDESDFFNEANSFLETIVEAGIKPNDSCWDIELMNVKNFISDPKLLTKVSDINKLLDFIK